MVNHPRSLSLKARQIIMYLLIVSILCIGYLPVGSSVRQKLISNYEAQTEAAFSQSMERLTTSLQQAYGITDSISYSTYHSECASAKFDELTQKYLGKLYMAGRVVISHLSNISVADQAFLIYNNTHAVVDKSQIYLTLDSFLSYGLHIDDLDDIQTIEVFSSGTKYVSTSSANVRNKDIGSALVMFFDRKSTGVRVGVVYSENSLKQLFDIGNLPSGSSLVIKNSDGEVLFAVGGTDDKGVCFSDYISLANIGVTLQIPKVFFTDMVKGYDRILLITMTLLLLGGYALSIWFTRISYKPVKNLMALSGIENSGEMKNEYDHIAQHIRVTKKQIDELSKDLRHSRRELRSSLFARLINNTIYATSDKELVKQLFPQLQKPCRILLIQAVPTTATEDRDVLLELRSSTCLDVLEETFDAYYLQIGMHQIAILIPDRADLDTKLENLFAPYQSVFNTSGYSISAGISNAFDDPAKMSAAWQQAQIAVDIIGNGETVHHLYDPIQTYNQLNIDIATLQQLYEAILTGHKDVADNIITSIENTILANAVSKTPVIQSYSMFTFVFENAINALRLTNLPRLLYQYDDSMGIRHLFDGIREDADMILTCRSEQRKKVENKQQQGVVDYINNNFREVTLNADSIGKATGFSANSVYQIVRNATGLSLGEYIEGLRLDYACQLLHSTDTPISAVTEACGFGTASTFYRVFKQKYGVTPAQWRENHT